MSDGVQILELIKSRQSDRKYIDKKIEKEKFERIAEMEIRQLKELHFMRCPKCGMELSEIDYKSIRVDKCFGCDGIWLDAGELESVAKLEKGALDKLFGVFKK